MWRCYYQPSVGSIDCRLRLPIAVTASAARKGGDAAILAESLQVCVDHAVAQCVSTHHAARITHYGVVLKVSQALKLACW